MKTKLKKLALSAALATCFGGNAFASGIPVIDAAAIAQLVMELQNLQQQLNTQRQNLKQVTATRENFIGEIDAYSGMINSIEFRKTADGYIPVNVNEVLSVIRSGNSDNPEITATIDKIMSSSTALYLLEDQELQSALENSRRNMAYYQAAYNEAYNSAGKRSEMAVNLGKQSATTTDEKQRDALSLAIQSENVVAVNEVARLLAMEQMKKHEAEEQQQNRKELDSFIMQNRHEFFQSRFNK